jgi:tetratricopeptide (TPR) repeat protein
MAVAAALVLSGPLLAEGSDRPQPPCTGGGYDPARIIKACSVFLAGGTASALAGGEAYRWRGRARGEDGDPDGALEDLTKALSLDPRGTEALFFRGQVQAAQDRLELARSDFEAVLAIDPGHLFAWLDLGTVHFRQKRHISAEQAYGQAIRLQPDNAAWYEMRAWLRWSAGGLQAALDDYDKAASLSLESSDTTAPARAILLSLTGRSSEGLAGCNVVVEHYADQPAGYYCRAVISIHLKRADDAIADFDRALALARRLPDLPENHPLYGRGVAKWLKGDLAGGEADMRAAEAVDPSVAEQMARNGVKP